MNTLSILELTHVAGGSFELEMATGATAETTKSSDCTKGPGGVNTCGPSGGTSSTPSGGYTGGTTHIRG